MMRSIQLFTLLLISLFTVQVAVAQKKQPKNQVSTVKKFKQPKLKTFLEGYSDSVSVTVTEAEKIIASPLKVIDAKNNAYTLTYYQFMYTRKVVTEDEKTGKALPAVSKVADHFTSSPLPDIWVNTIRQQVKAGEELHFFDVIVKDTQGRSMYASELKITIR